MKIPQKSERIIIVDDEIEVVNSLIELLKSKNLNAEGETDSQKLLKRIDKEYFDIIVTDFKMPNVTGLDIAEKIKKEGIDSDVIIITGFGTMDIAIQSLKHGVYDFLLKPFKYEELFHIISKAIERRRLIKENKQLAEELERHIEELTTLYDINELVINSSSRDSVLNFATDTLNLGIGIASAGILLNSSEDSRYSLACGFGKFDELLPDLSLDLNSHSLRGVLGTNEITQIEDLELLNLNVDNWNGKAPEKLWFIPMTVSSDLVGFITIIDDKNEVSLSEKKIKLIKVLANQLGPQLKIIEQTSKIPSYKEGTLVRLKKRITKSIRNVEVYEGTVAFLYFRIVSTPESNLSGNTIEKGIETLGSLIQESMSENDELMQVGLDGFLATLYGKSKVESEIVANGMVIGLQSIHPKFVSSGMQIKIISQCYPEDNLDNMQLFHELLKSYTLNN